MSDQLVGKKGSDYPKLEDFTEEQRTAFLGSTLVHAVGKLNPSDTIYTDANLVLSDLKTDQIQADWNEQDSTKVSYIKNKPEIPSIAGLATEEQLATVSAKIESDIPSLDGYATEQYVNTATDDMATETWVGQQGYLTSVPAGYATEGYVDSQVSGKQDTIEDLDGIRSSAELGATAVQPDVLEDYALKTELPTAESLAGPGLLETSGKLKLNTDNSLTIYEVGYHDDRLSVAVPVPAPNNDHSDQGKVLTVDDSDQIVWEQPSASVVISPYNGKFTTVSAVDDVSSGGYAFNLNLDDETLESAIDTENERKYVKVKNPLPSAEGASNGDVLTVTSGQVGWAPAQGGFPPLPADYATKDYYLHINKTTGNFDWAEAGGT